MLDVSLIFASLSWHFFIHVTWFINGECVGMVECIRSDGSLGRFVLDFVL